MTQEDYINSHAAECAKISKALDYLTRITTGQVIQHLDQSDLSFPNLMSGSSEIPIDITYGITR